VSWPRIGVYGRDFPDGGDELAAPANELRAVPLTHDAAPALGARLRRGERAETVQMQRLGKCRRGVCPPLPGLGERRGGVVLRGDAGERVAEPDQVGGEDVGLPSGERGNAQPDGLAEVEDGANLAFSLQPAENDLLACCFRSAGNRGLAP
jgi:hypothetical protein